MYAGDMVPGDRIEIDLDVSLTVQAAVSMWNGNIAVLFYEVPVSLQFGPNDWFDSPDTDWHMSSLTHSYR